MSAQGTALPRSPARLGYRATSLVFLACAIGAFALADVKIAALQPWQELRRLFSGLLGPDLMSI